jgi:uncharacterized membrane protein
MAPCRALCFGFFALIAIIVTIALALGRGKEADMGKVDQAAIEGSKKVRIQQGGMVNFTGLEITTGDNTFPIMTMVAIIVSLVLAVGAGVWMNRRCRHVDTVPQDLEMANIPMADPESLPSMEDEAEGHCLPEGMEQPNTEDTRHPVMLALLDSLDE